MPEILLKSTASNFIILLVPGCYPFPSCASEPVQNLPTMNLPTIGTNLSVPNLYMSRWFNTAGPCREDIHYMLCSTLRIPNLERLIMQQSFFVIHAP